MFLIQSLLFFKITVRPKLAAGLFMKRKILTVQNQKNSIIILIFSSKSLIPSLKLYVLGVLLSLLLIRKKKNLKRKIKRSNTEQL